MDIGRYRELTEKVHTQKNIYKRQSHNNQWNAYNNWDE